MTDAYVIEIGEEAIGLVVREAESAQRRNYFRFYASVKGFQSLEGKSFTSPESAKRSAVVVAKQRQRHAPIFDLSKTPPDHALNLPHLTQVNPIDLTAAC